MSLNLSAAQIKQANQLNRYLNDWHRTWAFKHLIRLPHEYICLFTGNQCLGGESEIYDPVKNTHIRIDSIDSDFHVLAWDGEKMVTARALKPYKKDVDKLFRFNLSNGQSFVASMHHRILTLNGYCSLSEVLPGCAVFRPRSISGFFPEALISNDDHSFQTVQDFQSDYPFCCRLCDERLQLDLDSVQVCSPLQVGVPEHTGRAFLHKDDRGNKEKHIRDLRFDHLSSPDDLNRCGGLDADFLFRGACIDQMRTWVESQATVPPYGASCPSFLCNDEVFEWANFSGDDQTFSFDFSSSDSGEHLLLTSLSYLRDDVKWDFGVPRYHNYYHAGVIHHNSMKTASVAYQYVMRIFGHHPVPKKNILYLECKRRDRDNLAPHGYFSIRDKQTGVVLKGHEKGTWSIPWPGEVKTPFTLPEDGICPYCGENIVVHYRKSRIFRFSSENLPTDKEDTGGQSAEIKSSVYPEFKKWLPDFLIKRDKTGKKMDITVRSPSITIIDPNIGTLFFKGTKNETEYVKAHDIIAEFVSYNQQTQSGAGVQRASIWIDEHAPFDFFDEQASRGFAEDADTIVTLTPALGFSWEFDYLFEEAEVYIRTPRWVELYKQYYKKELPLIERTDSDKDYAVIQAATDDNPTFSPQVIAKKYLNRPDPDGTVIPMRRLGVFKQASGRIFKQMNTNVHVISAKKHGIDEDFLYRCTLARCMDYHKRIPHHILWIALSPDDECFVYKEFLASPDKWVHERLAQRINELSEELKFNLDLMDPLAKEINQKTGKTDMDEINEAFRDLKRRGISKNGGRFESWNTKGEAGRNEIKTRLDNSSRVGKPFNNYVIDDGIKKRLPTLWFTTDARECVRHFKHWRWENYVDNRYIVSKEKKQKFEEKFSHFPMCLEAAFKDRRFRPHSNKRHINRTKKMFRGAG